MAMKRLDSDYFSNWNYKKHAKFCTAVYLSLYAFDMTASYFIIKKMGNRIFSLRRSKYKGSDNESLIIECSKKV